MRSQTIAQGFVAVLLSLSLAACGGGVHIGNATGSSSSSSSGGSSSSSSSGGSSSSGSSSSGSSSGGASAASLALVSSNGQLASNASAPANGVTLTAIVKDSNNNLLSGVTVGFSSTAGALQVTQPVTDSTGSATAILTTGGDQTDQSITVTASVVGHTTVQNTVAVVETGTSIAISGGAVIGLGSSQNYTVTLRDASNTAIANVPVTFKSSSGNSFTPASPATTNATGQVTFAVSGSKAGTDTLSASALGANGSTPINVSVNELSFSSPANGTTVKFNAVQAISILLQDNSGNPQAGKSIALVTDRGTLTSSSGSGSAVSATTGANGIATVNFQSDGSQGAGGVTITATAPDGTSVPLILALAAVTPASITIQANPSTIGSSSTSTVQALVLDAKNNPVPGITVDFIISADSSGGGSLSSGNAVTNSQGQAIVLYKSGAGSSGTNGVSINATVDGTGISTAPSNPATLTVAGNPFDITLGASSTLVNYPNSTNPTEYQQAFTVVVKDSAGHPAPANTVVNFQLISKTYQTGQWIKGSSTWVAQYNIATDGTDPNALANTFGCVNEDTNHDGILDAGDDNYMLNTQSTTLYPGNVGTITPSVTLDATGSGQVFMTYPKDYAFWVQYDLLASTQVVGNQYSREIIQVYPVAQPDVQLNVSPPGVNFGTAVGSPYGLWTLCSHVAGNKVGSGVPGYPGP